MATCDMSGKLDRRVGVRQRKQLVALEEASVEMHVCG